MQKIILVELRTTAGEKGLRFRTTSIGVRDKEDEGDTEVSALLRMW